MGWGDIRNQMGCLLPQKGVLKRLRRFMREAKRYSSGDVPPSMRIKFSSLCPRTSEYESEAGRYDPHYFFQDLHVARCIYKRCPDQHFDIGSRLDGFLTHLLVFTRVTYIDVRPLNLSCKGLSFLQDDATELSRVADQSVESLSCLHAAEHFGLGRYGDAIDPQGCYKLMASLQRVLAPGGHLYFSVPVGRERCEFNAHRVFAPSTILSHFSELELVGFAAIDDKSLFHAEGDPSDYEMAEFSCGIFEFARKK